MAIYRIAGLFVEMTPKYDRLRKRSEKYLYSGEVPSGALLNLDLSNELLEKKKREYGHFSLEECEYMWTGAKFSYNLIDLDGFVLHASAVAYQGNAYLFSADSGTGKSTHTGFWQEVFGNDKALIINDDKPAIRQIDKVFYALGTPFSGKHDISEDMMVPIKALCFIHRSEKNEIERLSPEMVLERILCQTLRPRNADYLNRLLIHLEEFLRVIPVYSLGVAFSPDSAKFAYEQLNK